MLHSSYTHCTYTAANDEDDNDGDDDDDDDDDYMTTASPVTHILLGIIYI